MVAHIYADQFDALVAARDVERSVSVEWQGGEWTMFYRWANGPIERYFEHNGFQSAEPPMVVEDMLNEEAWRESGPAVDHGDD